jgi:hypothetical protein
MRKPPLDPVNSGTLTWHHTELGRRTDCGRYHACRVDYDHWQLYDVEWDRIGGRVKTLVEAQTLAERDQAKRNVA